MTKTKLPEVRRLVKKVPGPGLSFTQAWRRQHHLNHPQFCGVVAVAARIAVCLLLAGQRSADFARTVDITHQTVADPAELFIDPTISVTAVEIGWIFAQKLGFTSARWNSSWCFVSQRDLMGDF